MEHVQYTLEEPWPQLKTLNELYILLDFPSPFKEWELSIHVGRRGQVQKKWRKKKPNFYTEGLEFVLLQKLDRGIQRTSGPYKFVGREGSFIVLEDSKKRQFAHPEFIERRWRGSLQYRSTAATIWSNRCLCQLCETSMPVDCFCKTVFNQRCYKCDKDDSLCRKFSEEKATKKKRKLDEQQTEELDASLSQDLCLCDSLFNHAGKCYCGFRPNKYNSTSETSCQSENNRSSEDDSTHDSQDNSSETQTGATEADAGQRDHRADRSGHRTPGQYIPALRWLVTPAVSRERAETLWRAATVPDSVTLTDVDRIFFARIPQRRYYEPKHPTEVIHEAVKYAEQREEALRYGEGMQGIYDEDELSSDPKHEYPNPDVKHDSRKSEQRLDDSKSEDNVKGVPLIDFTKLEPRDFDPQNTVPLIDFDTYDPREFDKPALKQDLLQAGYALGYRSDGSNESIGYMPDSIPLAVFRQNGNDEKPGTSKRRKHNMPDFIPLVSIPEDENE
ncbi:hypothetical protein R1sor_000064 [Riccia sorocarpa]|uniref:Uncharacterized protein n=1 Tax=Riccia sorocarpa TaxID=122646 RepID=A0ABD3GV42_9MARC